MVTDELVARFLEDDWVSTTAALLLLDVNVLLALVWDQHVHHAAPHHHSGAARKAWATTPVTESGLVRLPLTREVTGRQVTDLHLVDPAARRGARPATFDAASTSSSAPADRRHVAVWSA